MPWVSASTAHHLARNADLPDRAREPARRQLGLGPDAPGPLDIVPAPSLFGFLASQDRSGDRWLAVRAACEELDQQLSGLWHLARVLPTLGAAIAAMVRYNLLTTDVYTWSLSSARGFTCLATADLGTVGGRRYLEFQVVDRVRAVRALIPDFRLSSLAMPGPPPEGQDRLAEAVRLEPTWRAPQVEMVFDSGFLDRPLGRPDPILEAFLRRPLEERLDLLTAQRPTADRARELFRTLLQTGHAPPDRAEVAAQLGLAERTFVRRLADEGATWRQVRQQIVGELARLWLLREPVGRVAERLGYADGRSFARAFRRENGCSPREWLADQGAP